MSEGNGVGGLAVEKRVQGDVGMRLSTEGEEREKNEREGNE